MRRVAGNKLGAECMPSTTRVWLPKAHSVLVPGTGSVDAYPLARMSLCTQVRAVAGRILVEYSVVHFRLALSQALHAISLILRSLGTTGGDRP